MSLSRVVNLIVLFAAVASWGCSPAYRGAVQSQEAFEQARLVMESRQPAAAPAKDAGVGSAGDEAGTPGAGGLASLASSQPDVYLIKNATVTVECDDARTATNTLVGTLQSAGAYVSNLNEFVDALGRRTVTMQVRVPADKFDQSISSLESLGKILNKQVSTEDVTEEYVDTDSRVRNLKKTEERLIDHLNRAAQLEDILRVENELTRVREQIERMEGRLRFLTNRVSFSTITVTLQEKAKAEPIVPPQSFSTAKEFSEAIRSLVGFLQVIWSMVIWVLVWSPVFAAIVAAVYLLYRQYRKQIRRLNL
ncbi:MAG: DUF4349 domain-containing protein [Candidatus Hydrogenedentes bacterium]|nr:DUF4349 domain-containing protein [Candidatus Hydrogenedentota bacterium]